jgi:uncharacterized protein (DUF697 family)
MRDSQFKQILEFLFRVSAIGIILAIAITWIFGSIINKHFDTDHAYFISSAIGMVISISIVFKAFQTTFVVYTEKIIRDAKDVLNKVDDVELREYLEDIQFELRKIRKDD